MQLYNLDEIQVEKYLRHGITHFSLESLTWEGLELEVPEDVKDIWIKRRKLIISSKNNKLSTPDYRLITKGTNLRAVKVLPSRYDLEIQRRKEYQFAAGSILPNGRIEVTKDFLEVCKLGKLFRREFNGFDGVYIAVAPIYKN